MEQKNKIKTIFSSKTTLMILMILIVLVIIKINKRKIKDLMTLEDSIILKTLMETKIMIIINLILNNRLDKINSKQIIKILIIIRKIKFKM